MAIAIAFTITTCLWIIFWSLGLGGFDSLMYSMPIVLIVATLQSLRQYLPDAANRRGAGRGDAPQGGW